MNATASWYNAERVSQPGSVVLKNWVAERDLERKSGMTTGDLYKELLQQASVKSGVPVTWRTALQASTSFSCARVIAEGIAQVPFKLFKERASGAGMDPAKDHGLYELINLKPNEWQTSFEFREQIGLHLTFMGNAYVYKVRGLRGEIVELLPFPPNLVQVKRNGWERSYHITTFDGGQIEVRAEDMWHLRGISWDGIEGLPGIKLAREAIGVALALEEHAARMFSNGAKPGGILTTEQNLKDPAQIKLLREEWEKMNGGNVNAYKTAILSGGLTFQPLAQTGVDAQHLEHRRFEVENTCRFFRVLPIMVMQADKASTYASSEQMFIAHVVHTMMPWYTRLEQSADVNLLTAAEREQGYYTKFTAQALMRGASKDRAEYFKAALGAGGSPAWMTQDEVRALEEMNPMGGTAAVLPIATNVPKSQGANDAQA